MTKQRKTKVNIKQTKLPGTTRRYGPVLPSGDELLTRTEDDGLFRYASNNIAGSKMGKYALTVALDIKTTKQLGIDAMALQETRRPWTPANRNQYDAQCRIMYPQGFRNVFSSPPWRYDESDYQAGGTLLSANRNIVGRIEKSGADEWGRICWMTLRGRRDEGVLLVSGYRTPHKKSDRPGPKTGFTIQWEGLRKLGVKEPDPRQRFLEDLSKLIEEKRAEGYRPIIAMDANEDWVNNSHPEEKEKLQKFLERNQLIDPFYEKFKTSPRTYEHGPSRLDYIFIDPAFRSAVRRVGILGSQEGNFSDHSMCYIDFDSKTLFRGVVNRPIDLTSREFMLTQADKVLTFTCILRRLQEEHKIRERVFKLARCFAEHGKTEDNVQKYQAIDREHKELILCAASKAGHKEFGYARSKLLTEAGQVVILYKALLSCKETNDPQPSAGCIRAAERMKVELGFYENITYNQLRSLVATKRKERHKQAG